MIEQTEFPFQQVEDNSSKQNLYIGLFVLVAIILVIVYVSSKSNKKAKKP